MQLGLELKLEENEIRQKMYSNSKSIKMQAFDVINLYDDSLLTTNLEEKRQGLRIALCQINKARFISKYKL